MNVTSKGYYTSDYLNNVTRNRHVGLPDNERKQYDYSSRPLNRSHSPRIATSVSGDHSPNSVRSRTPVARTRTPLSRPRTPSQMDDAKVASAPGSPLLSPTVENFGQHAGKVSSTSSGSKEEVIYDPDYLEQGITPAELNVLQNKNSRHYSHKVPRDKALINGKVIRQSVKYPRGEYYIKQKQRYDESPYKPKFYTHKTFREVFEDEQELLEKYNPMESVFDDPESKREQEQNQIFKRAFKTIQTKLGKDNYNEYDYYKNKSMSPNEKRDVFVNAAGTSSGNDDDENDLNNKIYLTEEERKQLKKNKNFKNVWKRKLKKASKELSKDYSSNLDYLNGRIENISTTEPIVLEPEEPKEVGNAGPGPKADPEFHPLWNYILSWLVYDQTETPGYQEEPVVNNSFRSKKKLGMNKDTVKFDLRNIKKNYQGVVNKWGQPASALFTNGQIPQNQKSIMRRLAGSALAAPPGLLDDLSQEFIIELDDADDEESYLDEELYYDPSSRQLQRNPPTSFSSLYPQARFNKQRRNSMLDSSKGPVAIISNLNTLIKNIKIMRIIFAPIDIIAMNFPNLQTLVIMIELVIFLWLLYELSLLIDALCMMVKAVCAPMIAMGRFMNRIM
ncbi:uncharacterized protein AC631_03238 [Debaryomyces fabryi]|uniref:Uncharacterized protein n=1 Tax=Debaryomyces fabryi TaxID=58627 RepID=A0A0V1PXL0_9ASCO|nr:uncharacterized protein AC631_03238 [Debaryomyces fabryi]KSA00987.1 hypothetical protein AC631_03238 [Debaryomyces fabryi]CUM55430.1 unnamed protein product [Debaryomyces fabryi]